MSVLRITAVARRSLRWALLIAGLLPALISEPVVAQTTFSERLENSLEVEAPEANKVSSQLSGRVVDADGIPVAGARVDISTAAPRSGRGIFCPSCYLDCRKWSTTDSDGKFQIDRLDVTLTFRLLVTTPGMRPHETQRLDPARDSPVIVLEPQPTDWPPERTVRGIVVDTHGRPVPRAILETYGGKTATRNWVGRVDVETAVTDEAGRFAMLLPADYEGIYLEATADGFCGAKPWQLLEVGKSHRIELPAGAQVTARMTRGGAPVPGLRIGVVPTDRARVRYFKSELGMTDAEGRCKFEHLPPSMYYPGEDYVIYSVIEGSEHAEWVIPTTRFHAPENEGALDLGDLEVTPALSLKGRIELQGDGVIPNDAQLVLGRNPAWDLAAVPIRADGSFEATGLPPESYQLYLRPKELEMLDFTPISEYLDDRVELTLTESRDDLRLTARIRKSAAHAGPGPQEAWQRLNARIRSDVAP